MVVVFQLFFLSTLLTCTSSLLSRSFSLLISTSSSAIVDSSNNNEGSSFRRSMRTLLSRNTSPYRSYHKHPTSEAQRPLSSSARRFRTNVLQTTNLLLKSMFLSSISSISNRRTANAVTTTNIHSVSSLLSSSLSSSSSSSSIVIQKRPYDEREYKAMTLSNDMRVLLVSDPASSRAAAALDVHVGAYSDPPNVPGLAHFCEHMSFLGTAKYPKEDEYSTFLSTHGGSSNAYTDSEDTVYYFDINAEHLDGALDRFAQFFVRPLFTEQATLRELNAIDSEHAKNINSDAFRLYQLEKDGANPDHPMSKFPTGNKKTLLDDTVLQGVDLREELLRFHDKYYSADSMTLCVSSPQPISQMERTVSQLFNAVPNKHAPNPSLEWWGKVPPFAASAAAPQLLHVVPIGEVRRLTVSWPLWIRNEEERQALLRMKPESIVAHLVGHEGEGSIRSYLVKKNYGNGVQAAVSSDNSDTQIFEVSVDLTENGLQHINDIIECIYSYLHLLVKDGESSIPDYVFDEVSLATQLSFNYSEKSEPASYVSSLVTDMQLFKACPELYLAGSMLVPPRSAEGRRAVYAYLRGLQPSNSLIKVISKEFKNTTTEVSRFYSTEFSKLTVVADELRRWEQALQGGAGARHSSLHLPRRNELIPSDFSIIAPNADILHMDTEKLSSPPELVREDERWSVYYKLDESFNQPKVYIVISLAVSSDTYDALYVVNSKLFINCFLDSINEYLYEARIAGLSVELDFTSKGVQLIFSGYNDKMPMFIDTVIRSLLNFSIMDSYHRDSYDRFKDLMDREFLGWSTQQPYYHASYYSQLAQETLQYPISDLLAALHRADISMLRDFFRSALSRSYGTALVAGNVDRETAQRYISIVDRAFPFEPLPQQQRSRRRAVVLPLAADIRDSSGAAGFSGVRIARKEPNDNDDNSATTFYFQLPSRAIDDYMYLELLAEIVEQSFYNSLRTQQQLGYIVYSGLRVKEGLYSMCFTVQSAVVGGAELARRIETFIAEVALPQVRALRDGEFEAFKQGIATRKEEPDQRLTTQAGRLWAELSQLLVEEPSFFRAQLEVSALRAITRPAFVTFVESFLGRSGARRRLLVSQVSTTVGVGTGQGTGQDEGAVKYLPVEDELGFRDSLPKM